MEQVEASAASSVGEIKLIRKAAMLALWHEVSGLLSTYRDGWSADDVNARLTAAAALVPRIAPTGWLDRALVKPDLVVDEAILLREWDERA